MTDQLNNAAKLHNFPLQPTPFIGRTNELAEIRALLADPACRLLTLYGCGGIGKTRLALQAALELQDQFADGIYFVSVQSINSTELLVSTVAETVCLALSGQEKPVVQLLNCLRDKEMLLILDNIEQLLPQSPEGQAVESAAAAEEGPLVRLLLDILQAAPGLKLMVTAREVLNVQEEWLYPVHGLDFPAPTPAPAFMEVDSEADGEAGNEDQTEAYGAVQLFIERARRVRRDFSVTDERAAIVQICQLVGGMPLALELAAAWTKTLSCEVIAAEIQRNLDFLATSLRNTPPRQRSMRAVFDQSWSLLNEQERSVFKRLAVFRGGCRREAAMRVANASLSTLVALVDKSLLRLEPDGRYQMHALLRQYAAEQLVRSPDDLAEVYDLHCSYYSDFLAQRLPNLMGGWQQETITEIGIELENIRAAWQWAVELAKIEEIQKSAQPLDWFYQFQSRFLEGVAAFDRAVRCLEAQPAASQRDLTLAEVLVYQGWLSIRLGKFEIARTAFERSRKLRAAHAVTSLLGFGADPLMGLGLLEIIGGDYAEAARLGQEVYQKSQAQADKQNMAFSCYILTGAALAQGQYETAYKYAQQAYTLAKSVDNRWFMAYCLNELGNVACALGDYGAAKGYYEASYNIRQAFHNPEGMAVALNHRGKVALLQEAYDEARQLYEEALCIYRKINDKGGLATSLDGLGTVATAFKEHETARRYFQEALQIAIEMGFTPLALSILVSIAKLMLQTGQQARGIELLALARQHPAGDRETRSQAERYLADAEAALPSLELEDAVRRGAEQDLDQAAATIQVELATAEFYAGKLGCRGAEEQSSRNGSADEGSYPYAAELVEQLTLREFEVLQLIAEGYTNKQMAEELIISVGTAKWYTSQIYGKLNVSNRTQAVARARELALLN